MAEDETINNTANIIVAVMMAVILIAVFLLAAVLVLNGVSTADQNINGIALTGVSVINETGYTNSSGYTLSGASAYGFVNPAITALLNRTDGTVVGLNNATVSAVGIVTNASTRLFNNLSISYTYNYDTTNTTALNTAYTGIKNNLLDMVTNFFALMPTIGTILAVVVLIAGIVLLVLYVRRMKDNGSNEGTFQG